VKAYRDQQVAHHDFRKRDVTHYPKLDLMLSSATYYYQRAIAWLEAQQVRQYPQDIENYGTRFGEQAREIAKAALVATQGIEERVG
jgi:hypothetical protein